MPGYLNQTNITLKDRLKLHTGFTVTLRSAGSAVVPAALEKVGKQFMKVSGRLYVPNTLDEIELSVDGGHGKKDWLLIPLNKVVSLEPLKERGNNEDTA